MGSLIERLYFSSPLIVQNLCISLYGYKLYRERYIGKHDEYFHQLLQSQWYSTAELEQLANKRFTAMVDHAVKNVSFYRGLVQKERLSHRETIDLKRLTEFPIVTKEQLREWPNEFIAQNFRTSQLIKISTSGTTGKTLGIFIDYDSRRYGYAFFSRLKEWAGVNSGLPSVTFAGRTILRPDSVKPPFWRYNRVMNNYLFSSYHLSPQNLPYYVDALLNIQPVFIDSYPSSLYIIAKYMQENNLCGIYPRAIVTSSETLWAHQRDLMEAVFKCQVYDQYGSAEQVVFISQCEKGTYHIHPEFGIVEFLREDGSPAKPGEMARLVCTGFTNLAMPLIRYDIGDTAILSEERCTCGRNFPVIEKLIGRTDDILVTPDGRQIGRLDPVFKGLGSVIEAQICQVALNRVIVRIVPGETFGEVDRKRITEELRKRLGVLVEISIETVLAIPRTSTGKFRGVVSLAKK